MNDPPARNVSRSDVRSVSYASTIRAASSAFFVPSSERRIVSSLVTFASWLSRSWRWATSPKYSFFTPSIRTAMLLMSLRTLERSALMPLSSRVVDAICRLRSDWRDVIWAIIAFCVAICFASAACLAFASASSSAWTGLVLTAGVPSTPTRSGINSSVASWR